ncbi:MAG: HAD family hydrolase [Streptosporangiaceae bacterium]
MSPPRLVATDLDGTLVRSDSTISARTVAALARVERAGADLVFVTGRPPRWMHGIADATGHRGVAVCGNGAVVYDLHAERVIASRLLDAETMREVVSRLRASVPDLVFAVERESGFARERTYVAPHQPDAVIVGADELFVRPAAKLLAQHPELGPDTLLRQAREVAGDTAELTHSSTTGLIEISASGVSKASTLAVICEKRGIAPSEVVAFGDMPNDLPMLAWAGTAYAVANAHPTVLTAVTRHTPSNDDDGVARVLERLFPDRRADPGPG